MAGRTPLETIEHLIEAFQRGDVPQALASYEQDATLVVEPDQVAQGQAALHKALADIIALNPTLTTEAYTIYEVEDLALYCSRWRLEGTAPDGSAVHQSGTSTDVLRRAPDGSWRIAIDNPLGHAVLG